MAFTYRWYRNGAFITGATSRTYTVTPADHGRTLQVRVEGSKDGYPNASKRSAQSARWATGSSSRAR